MTTSVYYSLFFAAALTFVALTNAPAQAQSTTFTYQGSLDDGGAPASGLHDLRFRLYGVASGGVQIGSTLCVDNVSVVEGVFTAQLDFGQQFATTAQRFLEIDVRRDTGLNCANAGGFIVLAPRQQLTAAPMASHANSAFSLDAADGSPTNAVFVDNGGSVGVGITTPLARLHVLGNQGGATPGEGVRVQGTSVGVGNQAYFSFGNSAGVPIGYIGDGSTSDDNTYLTSYVGDVHLYTPAGAALTAKGDGKVGIGTTTPRTALHVNGQSAWITGGNGGALPAAAGAGLRLYDDGSRSNIFAWDYASNNPRTLALQEPGGNVGIGTTTPNAKLEVRGDVKLGSSGQLFASGGVENLRIVRGALINDGTVTSGSGFSVNHFAPGQYLITFTSPFSAPPSVSAMAQYQSGASKFLYANIQSGQVEIRTINTFDDELADCTFTFIAIGPR